MLKYYPKKRIAPKFLAYFVTLLYIVCGILSISLFVFMLSSNFNNVFICFALLSAIVILLLVFNFSFAWVRETSLEEKKDKLIYCTYDIIGVMGKDVTKYTICSINDFKETRGKIKIKGKIFLKEVMSKEKVISSITIPYYSSEMRDLLKEFKNK